MIKRQYLRMKDTNSKQHIFSINGYDCYTYFKHFYHIIHYIIVKTTTHIFVDSGVALIPTRIVTFKSENEFVE